MGTQKIPKSLRYDPGNYKPIPSEVRAIRALYAKVLHRAIIDLQVCLRAKKTIESLRELRTIIDWFESKSLDEDVEEKLTFRSVCEVLELRPAVVLQAVRAKLRLSTTSQTSETP